MWGGIKPKDGKRRNQLENSSKEKKYGEVILEKPSNPLITQNPSNSKP